MYEKMYHILFEAISDALDMIEWQDYQSAMTRLEIACIDAEEVYLMQGHAILDPDEGEDMLDFEEEETMLDSTESFPISGGCPG